MLLAQQLQHVERKETYSAKASQNMAESFLKTLELNTSFLARLLNSYHRRGGMVVSGSWSLSKWRQSANFVWMGKRGASYASSPRGGVQGWQGHKDRQPCVAGMVGMLS